MLYKPDHNDYLTDDDSDTPEFELKVPELDDLLDQFEKDDPTIHDFNEKQKEHVKDLEVHGFEPEPRH